MTRKRILIVSLDHVERASVFTRQAEELAKHFDVGFAFPHRPDDALEAQRPYERFLIRLHAPRGRLMRPLCLLEFVLGLWRASIRFRPDAIHAHNLQALMLCYPVAKALGAKLVYDAHELCPDVAGNANKPFRRWRQRVVDGALSRCSDLILAAIESRAEIMQREYRLQRMPAVVHNAPPLRPRVESTRARDFVAQKGRAGDRIVLYQGMISPNRHLDDLVRAVQHFPERTCLVLLGYGNVEYINSIIRMENLQDRVFVHEPVYGSAYHEFTCSADVGVVFYVATCRNHLYCAPSKVYEYAMAELPMIGNALPTLQKYLEGDGLGSIARTTCPEDIAAAVTRLLTEPRQYEAMKERCRQFASKYQWDKEKEVLLAAYRGLWSQ